MAVGISFQIIPFYPMLHVALCQKYIRPSSMPRPSLPTGSASKRSCKKNAVTYDIRHRLYFLSCFRIQYNVQMIIVSTEAQPVAFEITFFPNDKIRTAADVIGRKLLVKPAVGVCNDRVRLFRFATTPKSATIAQQIHSRAFNGFTGTVFGYTALEGNNGIVFLALQAPQGR